MQKIFRKGRRPEITRTESPSTLSVKQNLFVAGFIKPYVGGSLDLFETGVLIISVGSGLHESPSLPARGSPTKITDVPITDNQLLHLTKGKSELSECEVIHGDICFWRI